MTDSPVNDHIPEHAPAMATKAAPVAPDERIQTIDVLRGLALLGILLVNVAAFASPGNWFDVHWDELNPVEYAIEALTLFFVQGKFYTLFAFLFGLGFAIQLARAEQKGIGFSVRFLWRMVLLYAIGVIHIVVLWDGDVLASYAAGGVFLLVFYGLKRLLDRIVRKLSRKGRERAPRWLALVVAGLLLFGPMLAFGGYSIYLYRIYQADLAGETLSESEAAALDELRSTVAKAENESDGESDGSELTRDQKAAETNLLFAEGSYTDAVSFRVEHLVDSLLIPPVWLLFMCLFMIGAYIGRHAFIERAHELRRGFRRLTIVSLLLGVPLSCAFVWVMIVRDGSPYPWWGFLVVSTKTTSGLAMCLAMIGAITLGMMGRARRWLLYLAPVGRMALTNYLLQSLVSVFVFYGHGLGLMTELGSTGRLVYCLLIFGLQIPLSHWWLDRYRFGPVEWLWRSLTYLRRQPMRRA